MNVKYTIILILLSAVLAAGGPSLAVAQDGENDEARTRAEERNRGRQSNQQSNNNRNQPGQQGQPNPAGNQPPQASPNENNAQRQRQEIRERREAERRNRQPAEPTFGELSVQIDTTSRLLRIHPEGRPEMSNIQVTVGEEFTTEITFDNQDSRNMTGIRVFLSFDSEYLEPVSISDKKIAPFIKGEPVAQVDPLYGLLLYEAELTEPVSFKDVPLLTVKWEATKISRGNKIRFGSRDDNYTVVVGEGNVDLLGSPKTPGDGTLDMTVVVVPESLREAESFLNDPLIFQGTDEKIGRVKLFIEPQPDPIYVGDTFYFDVVLDNRNLSAIDGVHLLLSFDPQVMEVIDADQDNFITLQKNILDGMFRTEFPWTIHIDNVVYQNRGFISYRVGTGDPDMTRGKLEPFVRVYAVATKATAATPVVFKFAKRSRVPGTRVTYNGQDCLGDPQTFGDGARGVALKILPQPIQLSSSSEEQVSLSE